MELILWRHAEADDQVAGNLSRPLSARGHRQVAWMAAWLQQRLPTKFHVYTSPAEGAQQTCAALGAGTKVSDRLLPGGSVAELLDLVGWPDRAKPVSFDVGPQPLLGRVAAQLLTGVETDLSIRKGGLWWIARREREGKPNVVVRAVVSPDVV